MPQVLWIVLSLIVLSAVLLAANPRDERNVAPTDKGTLDESQISPMGAIARGDVPPPTPEELGALNRGPWPVSESPMSQQGSDKLTHSPTATDFQSETTIAKSGNYVVVGYNDTRGFAYAPNYRVSGYAYSSDGGSTWTDGGQLPAAGGSSAVYGDPDVKTWTNTGTGQVYFFYSSLYVTTGGQSSLCLHVSTDGGATWVGPREVTSATNGTDFPDKVFMGVDPETGRIFLSWTNFGTLTTMRITYSDDLGLTWSVPSVFSTNVGQGSVPRAAGNSSNVYLAWRTSATVQLVRSTNNGATWGAVTTIASGLANPMNPYGSDRIHGFVGMDVNITNGYVYIIYASRNLSPDFSDIYFTRSTNAGVSWSTPVAINSRPGQDRAQFFPWLSVDQASGRIDAMWYDQINGTGSSDITDVFHSHSTDNGLTWSCPTPLTDKPFHAEYGNTTSQPNIGDYNQCVSDNGMMYTSFAKTDEPSYLTYAPDTYVDEHAATPPDAPVRFSSVSFTESGCTSNDGYIQAGEAVDITLTIQQYSNCVAGVTTPTGTLTTTTPGVVVTQGSSGFGSLSGAGTTATNTTPFVIQVGSGFAVPAPIDLLVTLATPQGAALIPFRLQTGDAAQTTLLSENFDSAIPPSLPSGWTSANFSGTVNVWKTSSTYSASAPNAAYCADIATSSGNRLQSPSIVIPAGTDLVDVTFSVTHNLELNAERKAYDGAILRVEINDGIATTTKLAGAFASLFEPFYPWQIDRYSASSQQPLMDLSCWSSNVTPTFSAVHIQFPGLAGTTIRLFFELGTDPSTGSATGMFVDNVVVKSIDRRSICTDPPLVAVVPASVDFASVPAYQTRCDTVQITNNGPTNLSIAGIYGCTAGSFSIDTTMTAHSLTPGSSTTLAVCVTPTGPGPESCQITVASNAANGPTAIPVTMDVVTAVGDPQTPRPFDIVSVSPNPFNPSTTVRFTLPKSMPVTAEVWSVTGARVRVLASGKPYPAGANELRWDGRNDRGEPAASGVYFVRLRTQAGEKMSRAVLLK